MKNNNSKHYAGCDIEFFSPIVEVIKGYDEEWTREKCMTPIYIDPSEFSDDVELTID